MTTSIKPKEKLTGADLKSKVDELVKAGEGFSACCRETGYVNQTATGNSIPAASQFSRALLTALGYDFPSSGGGGGGGRSRDYVMNVMKAGNAILSKGYLKEAGFNEGDPLKIEIKDDGSIILSLDGSGSSSGGASGMPMEITRTPVSDDWSDDFAE